MPRPSLAVVLSACLAGLAAAQQPFEFLPGAKYEPAVPTPQQVVDLTKVFGLTLPEHGHSQDG